MREPNMRIWRQAYKIINKKFFWLLASLAMAAALRFWLVYLGRVPFNSDEAIVGLMARHIMQGETPVFFYGQAYMGSLDAVLVAMGFKLFGEHVWVIRLVQSILFLAVMISTYLLAKQFFRSAGTGAIAVGLLAVPSINVVLYTTASLGGYVEALLIGNLIMLIGMRIAVRLTHLHGHQLMLDWLGLGILIGLGFWTFGLTLVYSLPTSIYLIYIGLISRKSSDANQVERKNVIRSSFNIGRIRFLIWMLIFLAGFLIGTLPIWGFAIDNGLDTLLLELRGEAIRGIEGLPWLAQSMQHLINLVVFGGTVIFGLRPPWDVIWLGLPLWPFVLAFWFAVIFHIIKFFKTRAERTSGAWILLGVFCTVTAGFVFTPFGADPSGRYFLPLVLPMTLFASDFIDTLRRRFGSRAYGWVVLLLSFNLWGIIQCALQYPPGITTQFYGPARIDHRSDQELINFLLQNGETRGYSNYWVSYPLAFLSHEQIIYIPRLPYHPDFRFTMRDDRYLPYGPIVEGANRISYITTKHEGLDQEIRNGLLRLHVTWKESLIGDYRIFYELSKVIHPEELQLPSGE